MDGQILRLSRFEVLTENLKIAVHRSMTRDKGHGEGGVNGRERQSRDANARLSKTLKPLHGGASLFRQRVKSQISPNDTERNPRQMRRRNQKRLRLSVPFVRRPVRPEAFE